LDVTPEIYESIKCIARRSRMVSHPEVRKALSIDHLQCEELLDQLVGQGLLRRATSNKGQTFYWLAGTAGPTESND
jgi:hypothetical protein